MTYEKVIDPICRCGAIATLRIKHGPTDFGLTCFPCADAMIVGLAVENVRGGSTAAATREGYWRWRAYVGHPCTEDEAAKVLGDL
jgi:hypothetical protein